MHRYLFGPVTLEFAREHLEAPRQSDRCLAWAGEPGLDLVFRAEDSWATFQACCPAGWQPEALVLYLPYTTMPPAAWAAPVPIIGLAPDWNLCWHAYRHLLPLCDLVLTDSQGVEVLAREGITHVRAANLFGCERRFLQGPDPAAPRDIDLLFVGNLHPAVQRERLPYLARIAALGYRWRVVIRQGVFGDEYRQLLARARIVFNRSIRGEANKRAFEAAAAGALLFQEAENREIARYFPDREACVLYTDANLEALLEQYLEDEPERQRVAANARQRVVDFSFERFWEQQLDELAADGPVIQARMQARLAGSRSPSLPGRLWQALSSRDPVDPTLAPAVAAAGLAPDRRAETQHQLGLLRGLDGRGREPPAATARAAADFFARAEEAGGSVVTRLCHVLALAAAGDPGTEAAIEPLLAFLDHGHPIDPEAWDDGLFPPGFDDLRVEWERAAWAHAGRPEAEAAAKQALLRWRLYLLQAERTRDPLPAYEAVTLRPDLGSGQALLGTLLAERGSAAAIPHLRAALAAHPFVLDLARMLFEALGRAGDGAAQRRLAADYRLLQQAAPELLPAEGWMRKVPPVGDERVSIIILCHNQVETTRACLESLVRHTRRPYELILVDNASTDATPELLAEVQAWPGPCRVCVLRNATNVGFPAGCNQGLARARGRYLVFLNNDTRVTAGWLDGLVGWSLVDWPAVGLVGPVTSFAGGIQQIAVDYTDAAGLEAFAAHRRTAFAGQATPAPRLSGFCLLVRREVLQQIGGFDERFGLGFFDDDDLCVRAQAAGYQLLVAQDVFVHHDGSRTFQSLGVDCRQQLQANFARFQEKWGPEHTAGYRLLESGPAPPAPPAEPDAVVVAEPRTRPRVSLCMIVKNEEANLPDCLRSVAEVVDEIVIADTGSTDGTRAIAQAMGARVIDFPWVDSFAAARNASLDAATGDWIFWMDADDRLDEPNRRALGQLFGTLQEDNVGYTMKCVCLAEAAAQSPTVVDHVRLFPRRANLRWQYRVHEQILPALRRSGGEPRWTTIVIQHTGYRDPALRQSKLARDLRLLEMDLAEHPGEPFILFNLGSVYLDQGRTAEALEAFQQSLAASAVSDSIVRKLYALICQCHRQLHQPREALAACTTGRSHYPQDVELLFLEALVRLEQHDYAGAERRFLEVLGTREGDHFASVDAGLHSYKARHNLGALYAEQGRMAEAEAQWQAAVVEAPHFAPAWIALGNAWLSEGRWPQAAEAIRRADQAAPGSTEVARLAARLPGDVTRRSGISETKIK